jgi:hypothetical protein
VSRGTIEELKYQRQIYKRQLKKETLLTTNNPEQVSAERSFRGISKEKDNKGELFGIANLLKFKDGTFMKYGDSVDAKTNIEGCIAVDDLSAAVNKLDVDDFQDLGADPVTAFDGIALRAQKKQRGKSFANLYDLCLLRPKTLISQHLLCLR